MLGGPQEDTLPGASLAIHQCQGSLRREGAEGRGLNQGPGVGLEAFIFTLSDLPRQQERALLQPKVFTPSTWGMDFHPCFARLPTLSPHPLGVMPPKSPITALARIRLLCFFPFTSI